MKYIIVEHEVDHLVKQWIFKKDSPDKKEPLVVVIN